MYCCNLNQKIGRSDNGKQAWLALQSKYKNSSWQRRRIILRRLDSSVLKPDIDSDVFSSVINQTRNELSVLDEAVSTERLTTIILNALPAEIYLTVKLEAIRDPDLSLEHIRRMMRTTFIDHSEEVPVTKHNQESKRYQESNFRGQENGRESATSTDFITCYY